MPIAVTPFIFLLNFGAGLGMCGMFLGCAAHKRMGDPAPSGVGKLDMANISLSVVITSLFLLWSTGSLLGAYFGNYAMFQTDGSSSFETIEKTDIFVDIFQKTLQLCVLGLVSLQSTKIGNRETLIPWGKCCVAMGVLQAVLVTMLQGFFKGTLGVLLVYMFSALLDGIVGVFCILTCILISRSARTQGVRGYFAHKIATWNLRIAAGVFLACVLDFISKAFFSVAEVFGKHPPQLFVDLASLCKCGAPFLTVFMAYSSRIPKSKAYSIND
ncbi:hypothetical protein NECID01_1129 [Nematocida sp. AWRm77]|nr:hypothetical protein NECID01_1129 [Nematocida sp. AWRm77]